MTGGRKVTLAEIMGEAGIAQAQHSGGMRLDKLHEILGEAMPELPRNPVGRHRLIRSLGQRFGPNFRSLPGVKDLVSQFDSEIEFEKHCAKIRAVKYVPTKKAGK